MTMRVDPRSIIPRHDVQDWSKVEDLAIKMKANGWTGRPLLALEYDGSVFGLTGVHRREAAIVAGLATVPVRLAKLRRGFEFRPSTESIYDPDGAVLSDEEFELPRALTKVDADLLRRG